MGVQGPPCRGIRRRPGPRVCIQFIPKVLSSSYDHLVETSPPRRSFPPILVVVYSVERAGERLRMDAGGPPNANAKDPGGGHLDAPDHRNSTITSNRQSIPETFISHSDTTHNPLIPSHLEESYTRPLRGLKAC